jgi:hypothetical protein
MTAACSYSALINDWAMVERPDLAKNVMLQKHDDFLAGNYDVNGTVV